MAPENSTLPDFRAIELNTLALDVLRNSTSNSSGGHNMPELSLSSLSFGILTVLFLASIYFLLRRRAVARASTVRILLLSTVLLYASTAVYMATILWVWSSQDRLASKAAEGLFSPSFDGRADIASYERAFHQQSWILTVTMSQNLMIGDAIVWWRACAIWQNKLVRCLGPLLVTFSTAVSQPVQTTTEAFLLTQLVGNPYSQVAVTATLATNALATLLIAYKAWQHRQLWKRHFAGAGATSQVLDILALLVESGCIYCALLTFVIFYLADPAASQAGPDSELGTFAFSFIYGCLSPFMAIYPTLIIVLVALKRSPIDTSGLSRVCRDHSSGLAGGHAVSNTLVFHHTTSDTSDSVTVETESPREVTSVGEGGSGHSLQTSTVLEETKDKDVGYLV